MQIYEKFKTFCTMYFYRIQLFRAKKPLRIEVFLNYILEFIDQIYFLINPNSINLSCRNSPAVVSSYNFGLFSSTQFSKEYR